MIAAYTGSANSAVTVTGNGSVWNLGGGGLLIGQQDTGALTIENSGTVSVTSNGQIYVSAANSGISGNGTLTVNGGTLSAATSWTYVGASGSGTGTMLVENDGQATTSGATIGGGAFANTGGGSATVTGTGSTWNAGSYLYLDNTAGGTGLSVTQGGHLTDGLSYIGDSSPSGVNNNVAVSGTGSQWVSQSDLLVGYYNYGFGAGNSTGSVTISSGGMVSSAVVFIGTVPDGSAGHVDTITVDGVGSSLQSSGSIYVGYLGTGNLTISGGATAADVTGVIGYSGTSPGTYFLDTNNVGSSSVGTVTVTGAGSTWTNTGSVIVGDNSPGNGAGYGSNGTGTSTGTVTISAGGEVTSANAIKVAVNAGATGTINIGAAAGQTALAPGTISAPAIVFGSGDGSIVFNHTSTNYVFGIPIQGAGSLDVENGTTVLTASNTYTGTTTINGGTLDVEGGITSSSSVSVNSGGTLTGDGTVGDATTAVHSGATFAPGTPGAPGTFMTVTGNLAFQSGALYLVQVNSSGATFADVTGTASLAGNVNAIFASGTVPRARYTILESAGISGGTTFDTLTTTNLPPGFSASLTYNANDVFLTLTSLLSQQSGLNRNQQNVANGLNNAFNTGGALPPNFFDIFALSGPALGNALTQLDGEAATGAEKSAFQLMNEFLDLMLDPWVGGGGGNMGGGGAAGFAPEQQTGLPPDAALAYAKALKNPAPAQQQPQDFEPRWSTWGSGFGGRSTTEGNAVVGSNNLTASTYGYAAGMDYHVTPNTIYGFALAGGGTNWSLAQNLGTGRSDAFQMGVHGKTQLGPAYVSAALAFANHWFTTNRIALGDQLQANFDGQSYAARVEAGYRYAVLPLAGVTPYAALQAQDFHTPSYSETDLTGGGFGLSYNTMNATDTRSELGARFDDLTMLGAMPLVLRARLAWAHDWVSDPSLSAVFEALPGSTFTVNGAPIPHDSALTTAAAELHLTAHWTALAKFDGEFAANSQIYAGTGTLRYTW